MYLLISLSRERRHIQKAVVIVMMLSLMWFCHTRENGASPYTKHMKGCGHCYDITYDVVLSQAGGVTLYTKHTKSCGHCYDVIYDVVLSQECGILYIHQTAVVIVMVLSMMCATNRWGRPVHQLTTVASAS